MKIIDFNNIINEFNKRLKKYNNVEYTKIIDEYKIYLKHRYKNRNNENYINTIISIEYILKFENLFIPIIKNSPIAYSLKNIKKKNIKYNIITTLGSGYFGKVYKVEIDEKIYALKETKLKSNEFIETFANEISKLKIINKIKPKIAPKYYNSWINNNKGYILLEYINCGTLEEYLKKKKLLKKDYNELKKLINILHKHNLFHKDLHEGNILVECKNKKKTRFYLNDFGLTEKNILKRNYVTINDLQQTEKSYIKELLNNRTVVDMVNDLVVWDILKNNLLVLKNK
jgi:serine/threonine protein kinase